MAIPRRSNQLNQFELWERCLSRTVPKINKRDFHPPEARQAGVKTINLYFFRNGVERDEALILEITKKQWKYLFSSICWFLPKRLLIYNVVGSDTTCKHVLLGLDISFSKTYSL